jgi:hypothetical protein
MSDEGRPCPHSRGRVAARAALALLLVVAVSAACQPPAPPEGWEQSYLTRSFDDVALVQPTSADSVRIVAPWQNSGTNDNRVVLDRTDAPLSNDQTSCATAWSNGGWPSQEGVAVRILTQGERTRAVTVTKNVWGNATSVYVVHHWDTARSDGFGQLAAFDMSEVLGANDSSSPDTARRLCTRVKGPELSFKVWPAREPEPSWSDAAYVREVWLPDAARHSGRPGWYSAHLPPGTQQELTEMWTSTEDAPGTPVVK